MRIYKNNITDYKDNFWILKLNHVIFILICGYAEEICHARNELYK